MKSAIRSTLILSLSWLPAIAVGSVVQIAGAQTQPPQSAELQQLINQAGQQSQQGKPQQAIEALQQALKLAQQLNDQKAQATTLFNIGLNLRAIGQPQKALEYYKQGLPIFQAVGDRAGEATTLNNIGVVYQNTNRPVEAIANLEQSIKLTLQTRNGLLREQRQAFVQAKRGSDVALISLLIERQQAEQAYQWVNLTATAELADYTRLLNTRVANPEVQAAIDAWNQKNQQLQFLRQQLGEKYSDDLARQVRTLEAEVNQAAETLARQQFQIQKR